MKASSAALGGLRKLIGGTGLGARLARGGITALAIRMSSVGFSYLMFVVIARHMSKDGFGQFGFAFSFATFVAVIAVLGQPILVLRFIPAYQHEGRTSLLDGLIRDSRIAVLSGSLICALATISGSLIWKQFTGVDSWYLIWAALLMVAMAVSRHQAYMMRAFGNIALAMAPRDVIWRVVVIVCILFLARDQTTVSASYGINICSLTLLVIFLVQAISDPATRPFKAVRAKRESDRGLWSRESLGIWPVTIVQAAGPNVSVVVLGLSLSPEATGPFFAALKTAMLLTLPLAAGAIVGAPLISQYYGAGQLDQVQKVSRYLVIGITAPVFIGLLIVLLFGDRILGFFGPDFTSAKLSMTLIAIGALVNALSGPTGFIMNMTGHHRQFLAIMAVTQAVSLTIQPIAAWYFGMVGAAAAVALGMISWNVWVWRWSRRNLSIDPTFYAIVEWLIGRKGRAESSNETT